jgi:hypothetical protein
MDVVPRTADIFAATSNAATFQGGGTNYLVETTGGVLYLIYIDTNIDVVFIKSTNGGFTWSTPTVIFAGSATAVSVWYDRWSNIAAGLIHVAYQESATDDTFYRTINTASSDALSTQTTIFLGASTAAGGHLSITRAVGGNVYCKTVIDAGAEGGFFRLLNANVPNGAWDAARTVDETIATVDQMILLPDYDAADTQDILAIFWDASANEISRKLYDDSANSWSETSIATSMAEQNATSTWPDFAVAMDIANTRHFLVAWSGTDLASSRLRAWTVDSGSITALTDVVSSSTDDQGMTGITLDTNTGRLTVVYAGKTDGSETFPTAINIYRKFSDDSGTTWSGEELLTTVARDIAQLFVFPRRYINPYAVAFVWNLSVDQLMVNVQLAQPQANFQLYGG